MVFCKRLLVGTGGQVSVSAANFILSLILMLKVSAEDFGTYAFISVLIFLGFGVSNAVLSSPLMVALNRNREEHDKTVSSFFMTSIILGLAFALLVLMTSYLMVENIFVSGMFAVATLFLFIARLGRTYLYDMERALKVLFSDSVYALVIFIGIGAGILSNRITLDYVVTVMAAGAFLAFLTMGWSIWRLQWRGLFAGNWKPVIKGFQDHGRHALVGVLTTEATGRAHAYIVTLFLGPVAFAPLAAATLFFRPVSLVVFSLTQFERARLARLLRDGNRKAAWHALKFFYIAGGMTWIANVLLIATIMFFFGDRLFGDKYDLHILAIGFCFYALISALVYLRSPLSALLQANADFKLLAKATIVSSLVTVPLVALMVVTAGAIWSLAGVAAGEMMAACLIFKFASRKVSKT